MKQIKFWGGKQALKVLKMGPTGIQAKTLKNKMFKWTEDVMEEALRMTEEKTSSIRRQETSSEYKQTTKNLGSTPMSFCKNVIWDSIRATRHNIPEE